MSYEPDKIDKEYLAEMARILGRSEGHEKIAAMAGKPAAAALATAAKTAKKNAGVAEEAAEGAHAKLSKIASMPVRQILENEDFKRGFSDEIEKRRSVWEPAVVAWMNGEEE